MKRRANTLLARIAVAAALAAAAAGALAQEFPVRPVKLVVPQSAGGGADILARTIGQKLSEAWGQSVVVDNRPGAAGIIGTEAVAKAPADGYTLLMGAISTHAINKSLYAKLPYDPVKDFAPVTLVATAPLLVVGHPSVPAGSTRELIALAKAKPGQLFFGSAGSGNSTHLAGELFKTMANVDLVHVPYKGATPAETDLIGGQVSVMFTSILSGLPHAKAGKMKALAVTSARRSSIAPDLPTVAETGLPGYDVNPWYGVFAPAGTPRDVVAKIHRDVVRALQLPDVKQRFATLGAEPVGNTTEQFAAFVDAEIAKWAKVVGDSGARAD
jgi:tripartite-type tricarboxylate transporter receptor subunit TctC